MGFNLTRKLKEDPAFRFVFGSLFILITTPPLLIIFFTYHYGGGADPREALRMSTEGLVGFWIGCVVLGLLVRFLRWVGRIIDSTEGR